MDGIDHHAFTCSCLAADKQIHVVILGQNVHIAADPLDGLTLSHNLPGTLAHQFQAAPPLELIQVAADDQVHLFQIKRLLNVVAGPPLHGLYCLGHRAVSGDHDDLDVLIHLFKVLDVVQSQLLAQTVIQQYHVRPERLRQLRSFPDTLGGTYMVAQIGQAALQRHTDQKLVVYH